MELREYLALQNNRRRPHRQEERGIQIAVVNLLRVKYPKVLFTIAPSGMKLSRRMGGRIKASGYVSGTPDLMIFEPRGKYHGLFIELKAEKGVVSKNQKEFISALRERGYKVEVPYSYNEAINVIESYLKGEVLNEKEKCYIAATAVAVKETSSRAV